ncbi:MAG TPA: HEAT repeat domain-containing protein [Kofleriaceae bacterium]|nr:HEAT repeat domain-containing protein [Kofleriaceae bacterium]
MNGAQATNLGGAIIDLLESDRVELRAAAVTVLAAVGKGDKAVETALSGRLADGDAVVRRIALEALADMGTSGIAPRLIPLLRGDDDTLAERARELLAEYGAEAEAALRKEIGTGAVAARRMMAQLLLRRGTQPAIEAVLDQLSDEELGEQALQLLRAELDRSKAEAGDRADRDDKTDKVDKVVAVIEKSAAARTTEASKLLAKALAAAHKAAEAKAKAKGAGKAKAKAAPTTNGEPAPADPLRDPEVARALAALAALLRLIGYLARPENRALLLKYAGTDQPRPIRLAAIAGLRRIVAQAEVKGTEKVIEALIEYADGDDLAVVQASVDTLRGARIPEALAKPFAALAKSKNAMAQKLAMERLPAGGGASAIKPLIEALGGDDPTARDAAGRGLAKAPEAVLPATRALLAATDEQVARRYAGVIRSHRGHVSNQAIDELVDRVRSDLELHAKGKATTDQIVLERVLAELIADVAPARHVELLFERARKLRKAGKSVEAFGSLRPLLRSRADIDTAIDDEQRFLLAVLALEAAGEGLLRSTHTDDPVFEQFARLSAKGFPVATRLARESEVSDEAIYALGFRLLESGTGGNDDLGAELLQGIIEERPRSKLAKAARNKLKLTGHLDE